MLPRCLAQYVLGTMLAATSLRQIDLYGGSWRLFERVRKPSIGFEDNTKMPIRHVAGSLERRSSRIRK